MSRVLVAQLARFGDLVQTKRLMATLAAQSHEVHLCLDHSLAALAQLVYPDTILHPIQAHAGSLDPKEAARRVLTENRSAFQKLQTAGFDAVYNLNFSGLNFRLAGLFDPEQVRGYSYGNGQEHKPIWADMAMRWSSRRRLGVNLVDFWAGYAPDPLTPDQVNPAAEPGGKGVGVVLAGRESRRSLPPKPLAALVKALWETTGQGEILLLGSKAEADLGRAVLRELGPKLADKARNLAGTTDWSGLMQALTGLDAVLTPDTGTMHLACHLGVPVRAVFLSSAWCFETGPYGAGHVVYQAVDQCLPCLETRPCPFEVRCRAPFEGPELIRYVHTGKTEHVPPGLMVMESQFDDLGVTYRPLAGEDADAALRRDFRTFLSTHLGVGQKDLPAEPQEALRLYQPRYWMAEQHGQGVSRNVLD